MAYHVEMYMHGKHTLIAERQPKHDFDACGTTFHNWCWRCPCGYKPVCGTGYPENSYPGSDTRPTSLAVTVEKSLHDVWVRENL